MAIVEKETSLEEAHLILGDSFISALHSYMLEAYGVETTTGINEETGALATTLVGMPEVPEVHRAAILAFVAGYNQAMDIVLTLDCGGIGA